MMHALIIDDNRQNASVLALMLADEGISTSQVTQISRLEQTLADLGPVDMVFLDLEMPGRNGYDVIAQLQKLPAFAGVPIVAYSVHTNELNHARRLGFHSFLGKPLDPDRFPGQLRRILSGQPVWETV